MKPAPATWRRFAFSADNRAVRWLLALALAGCSAATDEPDRTADRLAAGPPVDIYLIAGQSNAVGGARIDDLSEDGDRYGEPFDAVGFAQELNCPTDGSEDPCETSRGWRHLDSRGGVFGVELSAGRRLRDRFGDQVVLLKHATNGSSLYADWDSSGERITLWNRMNEFLDQRLADLPEGSRVAGLFWIQGNADAQHADTADAYADHLSWLVTRLRQERGCVPVVLDRLHAGTDYPYRDVVRAEQEGLPLLLDDIAVIDVDDLALRDDDPPQHYTADSFITLGQRMANAMRGCD
jgi:hypothetical protein